MTDSWTEDALAQLVGKTLLAVVRDQDAITFTARDGSIYRMEHLPDCCESVWLEDVTGDLYDLVGVPVLTAEVRTNSDDGPHPDWTPCESFTWTFYEFATIKGAVTIRWFGAGGGYYSEEVCFRRIDGVYA